MTHASQITREIERYLDELEDAHSIGKVAIRADGTVDLSPEEFVGTFAIYLDDPEKLRLLSKIYEETSEITNGIVRSSMAPKKDTVDVEPWPVSPKFPELVSDACIEFCDSHGLNDVLRICLKQARETFSNIKNLCTELDYFRDDEPGDIGHIVIRLEVESDQKNALKEYEAYVDWMVENIAASDSNFFTLTVRRV